MPQRPLTPVKDDLDVGPMQEPLEDPKVKMVSLVRAILKTADNKTGLPTYDKDGESVILPPHPSPFRPEPFVNDPLAQQMLHRILRKVPQAGENLNGMVVGPNADTVDRFSNQAALKGSGLKSFLDYDKSNLLGTTNTDTGNVSLNPSLVKGPGQADLLRTLSHELMHVAGYGDNTAYKVGDEMFRKNWRKQ